MNRDNNYKLQKYQTKLDNSTNPEMKKTYEDKMKQYKKVQNLKQELLKPTPVSGIQDYKLSNISPEKPTLVFGYGAINEKSKNMPMVFERRALNENDVMFKIKFVGVCHSDWHTILNEWKTTKYPMIVGHEATAIVMNVGSAVTKFKQGDRVALSPLYNSCQKCKYCNNGDEQYCENGTTETYNQYDRLPTDIKLPTGPVTYGGYCNIMIAKEDVVFAYPENLPMDKGAPLLCAGLTVYNALKSLNIPNDKLQNTTIGVAGIGGLGHLLLKICKSLGIKTVALTTTEWKLKDSFRMGASDAILMKDLEKINLMEGKLDYIIDTIPFKHDLDPYLKMLKTYGTICVVGAFFSMNPDFNTIIRQGKKISGSNTAGSRITQEYLDFTSQMTSLGKDVLPDVEMIKFNQLNETRDRLVKSQCKYRYVIDVEKSM